MMDEFPPDDYVPSKKPVTKKPVTKRKEVYDPEKAKKEFYV